MSTPSIPQQIKSLLSDGPKRLSEIHEGVSGKTASINQAIRRMKSVGDILETQPEVLCLPSPSDVPAEVENPREESKNIETINKLLKSYDIVLDNIAETLESELSAKATIEEKINLIKSLRWLGATVDQLMKRWYLVHRGYDSNTKQAHEDAKQKTADRETQELENAPPEAQLKVVREYDESMREILENMPHTVQKKTKV